MTFSYSQSYDSAQTFLDDSESYLEIGFMKFAQMGSKITDMISNHTGVSTTIGYGGAVSPDQPPPGDSEQNAKTLAPFI